jgi:hypothetical protein
MKTLRNFSLSIVLTVLFALSLTGQIRAGFATYNEERQEKQLQPLSSISQYLQTGHFLSSLSENMESEFLQMSLFVYLTMCLYQKGSAESKKPPDEMTKEDIEKEDKEKKYQIERRRSHPVAWRLYENSLTLVLLLLFGIFFVLHARGSLSLVNEQREFLGKPTIGFSEIFGEEEFWFESFQNWQSEFFSIVILGLLSIFLRQKDSAQSKKMSDPYWKTGSS